MKLKNKTILIISNEPWGDVWYSKHNWAFELSKNNLVYFVNSPTKWQLSNLFKQNITISNYTDKLIILNYKNILPLTRYSFIFKINEYLIYKIINKYIKRNENVLFWSFDPLRLINPKKLNTEKNIYFIVDKHRVKRERILIEKSDVVITVSKILSKDISSSVKLLNLSHGISESEFISKKEIDIAKSTILYIGNIDHRLDYRLIKELLIEFPEERFLFVGKLFDIADEDFIAIFKTKKFVNVIYNEPVHFKELKHYINSAKLCLAPMKLEVKGNSINHHKLLQYLAIGKPVLSAKFNDYRDNDLLIEYENISTAIKRLKILLKKEESVELIEKRISFARQCTYSSLITKIESVL